MSGFAIDPVEATVGQNQQPTGLQQIGQIASTIGQLQQNRLFPLQQQILGTQSQTLQQELRTKQYAAAQQIGASAANADDYQDAIMRGKQMGLFGEDFASNLLGGNIAGLDHASLAPIWERNRKQAIMAAGTPAEVTAMTGVPTPTETGIGTQFENVNPFSNTVAPMGGPTSGFVPNVAHANAPVYHRYNPETQQDEIVTAGAAAANPAHPAGVPAGAPIGTEAGVTGNIQQGLGIQGGIINAALDSQNRRAALGTVIGLSKNLSTGPNADFWKGLGEWASEYGLNLKALGINEEPGVTAAREALDKLGWQVAQRQFQVLGGTGSNQQLQSAVSTSPHSSLSAEGIQNIAGFLQGNEDAIQAEARALQKWNAMPQHAGRPQSIVNFPNTWNQIYDPRAFQFKYEDATGQNAIMNGMSAKEKADFQRRQKLMTDMGYLQ